MWEIRITHPEDLEESFGSSASCLPLFRESSSDFSISGNSMSYWVSGCALDLGMQISKKSEEGDTISEILQSTDSDEVKREKLEAFCKMLEIKNASPVEVLEALENAYKDGFQDGETNVRKEVRKALGIF
jgi:hypothetical protein